MKYLLALILLGAGLIATAQNTKPELALAARGYPDKVVLRYFPTSPALMAEVGASGFIVERALFKPGVVLERLAYTPIKGSPFKCWDEATWTRALQGIAAADTTERQIAGLAMTLADPNVKSAGNDILADGLKTLMDERNQQDMKFAMALIAANRNTVAADGLALRATDTEVKSGVTYVYRARITGKSAADKNAVAYVKVTCAPFNTNYLLNNKAVKVTEGDERVAFSFPQSKDYYAFNVDRSEDGGKTYKRITTSPSFKLSPHGAAPTDYGFVDSNLTNYKKYNYRVLVSTLYADDLPLAEFSAIPRDHTPPPPPFLKSVTHINPRQVELLWETTGSADLKGFAIQRGTSVNGKFVLISKTLLSKNTRTYIDEGFDPYGNNYYAVEAVDTAGNVSFSFPSLVTIIDSIPPAAPGITSALIDTNGKVTIKIKPNTEKDFIGYQLLKANEADHEFSVVTETYSDSLGKKRFTLLDSITLNSLTPHIYYKVIAFDSHYNQSEPSKIIELKRRDTIPPVSPLITGFAVTDSTVVLRYANSPSADAVMSMLLRREKGKPRFDTIFVNRGRTATSFTDKKVEGGKTYEYAMLAKDESGLKSKTTRSLLITIPVNKRLPAPKLTGTYDANTKKITLNFGVDDRIKGRKLKIALYKRPNTEAAWVAYKLLDFEPGKLFTDDAGATATEYYTARVSDDKDNVSNFSEVLQINMR